MREILFRGKTKTGGITVAERISELQKQVDELKANQVVECHGILKGCDMVKQAVKDTAKEICDLILEHWQGRDLVECDWLRVAISEKYGVEVE